MLEHELEARLGAAYARHAAGDAAAAEAGYRAVLASRPEQVDALYLLSSLLATSAPEESLELAEKALGASRGEGGMGVDEVTLLDRLGAALSARGRPAQAAEVLARADALVPDDADRLFRLAEVQRAAGDNPAARQSLERYLALRPDDVNARSNLGALQFCAGSYTASAKSLEDALRRNPRHPEALNNLGNAYSQLGQLDKAADAYGRAVAARPDFSEGWINLAGVFHTQGRCSEAGDAYRRALAIDPASVRAAHGLNGVLAQVVPRWHFPMMNDQRRNEAYDRALRTEIGRRIDAGKPALVLDIGAGSGLLSMMAARAGAAGVVSCEMLDAVADVAEKIISANGYADRVALHRAKSTRLEVGHELPRRADVLVSEIFDVGLLGEYVLPVIAHARSELLVPDATIIPGAAKVFVMPIESPEVLALYRVRSENSCGFDLESFNAYARLGYEQLPIARYAYSPLAEPVAVLEFDFRNAVPDRNFEFDLETSRDGELHAWVFWFELDFGEGNVYSTSPFGPQTCWSQAIQIEPAGFRVESGASLRVKVIQTQTTIRFEAVQPDRPSVAR